MTQIKSHIPKIRFKEFSGEWEEKKLGEIFQINAGGDIDSINISSEKTEIFKYPIFANAEKNKGFYGYSDIYKIDAGVLTVAGRGVNLGIAHARNEKFYPIVRLLTLKPKYKADIFFFEYQINNIKFYIESTGVPQLTGPQISNYNISFPYLPEQQKIASFLSSVDEKIEKIKEKKKNLEKYKKGVMQKIFSQKIRFKDENGEEFGEWEEKKLGELFNNIGGTALEEYVAKNGEYNFISIGNYTIDGKYINNNQKIILNDKTKTKLLDKNNLVMVLNDKTSTGDMIGASILIDEDNKYIYNQRSERLICKTEINPLFAWFLLNSKDFRKRVVSVSQGGTQIYVNFGEIKKLDINLPTLKEQEKIADFLSGIDEKIEKVSDELGKMEEFKKGLLQGMFV